MKKQNARPCLRSEGLIWQDILRSIELIEGFTERMTKAHTRHQYEAVDPKPIWRNFTDITPP